MKCPGCYSENIIKIDTYTSQGYTFCQCKKCDLIFANPMKAGTKEWYESFEDYLSPSCPRVNLKWYESMFLENNIRVGKNRLFNIGCGKTIFLKKLQELGYEITAIDINENIVNFTKEKLGIQQVYNKDVMDFINEYEGEKFDIIIFFELLEHIEHPGEFMRNVKKILKEEGKICLSVPNRERLLPFEGTWDCPPHHLTRWGAQSLKKLLTIIGFRIDKIVIAPLVAEDLMNLFKIYFGTMYLENKMKKGSKNRLVIVLYRVLFKFRVIFYNLLVIIPRIFIKTKGLNIFVVARVKK